MATLWMLARQTARPASRLFLGVRALCLGSMLLFSILGAGSRADELRRDGPAIAEISPEARRALDQIRSLHGRNSAGIDRSDLRLLMEMERCARRLKVLIASTAASESDSRRSEALLLLRAEHAMWRQLVDDLGPTRRGWSALEDGEIERKVDALSRAIEREVAASERVAAIEDPVSRGREAQVIIRRINNDQAMWRRHLGRPNQSSNSEHP